MRTKIFWWLFLIVLFASGWVVAEIVKRSLRLRDSTVNRFTVSDKTTGTLDTEKLYNVRIVYGTNQWFNWSNTVIHVTFEDGTIIMEWQSASQPYAVIATPLRK